MLSLCGKTVLEIVIDRFGKYKSNIIIATKNDGTEAHIVNLCKSNNMNYNPGSTNNLLERHYLGTSNFNVKEKRYIC